MTNLSPRWFSRGRTPSNNVTLVVSEVSLAQEQTMHRACVNQAISIISTSGTHSKSTINLMLAGSQLSYLGIKITSNYRNVKVLSEVRQFVQLRIELVRTAVSLDGRQLRTFTLLFKRTVQGRLFTGIESRRADSV
jgi:hypothetical protein